MRIFGIKFPFTGANITASGELPMTLPKRGPDAEGLSVRQVNSSPIDDWFLSYPSKIPPKQIASILRQSLAGNLWAQWQLSRSMEDSWPVYKKCAFELRTAIAASKYIVHPYCEPGKKPTASAQEKADLVRRAIDGFRPDRFKDEDGFSGMIFDLTDAILNGISIVELVWDENAVDQNGNRENMIRASSWVNPRNIAFKSDGSIGVSYATESGNLSLDTMFTQDLMDNPAKFLVAKFKSKSGSPLGAGFMRTLAQLWVMVVYGRDFALNFAQKYGNPFLDIAYTPGMTSIPGEVDKLHQFAKQAASQGYVVHPNTSTVTVGKEHSMGGDNAQLALMRLADEQCQLLMLGQTLTTAAPKNGGSRAQGDVHEEVRQERLEELTKWVARILTEQFAESICAENYGREYLRNPERPTVEADFTRPLNASEQADFLVKVSSSKVPLMAEEIYKRAGLQQPSVGDTILIGGEPTIMEETVTATEKAENDFEQQLEQQVAISEAMPEPSTQENGNPAKAKRAHLIQQALLKADVNELEQLEKMVTAAERAAHLNGEANSVKLKIGQLSRR